MKLKFTLVALLFCVSAFAKTAANNILEGSQISIASIKKDEAMQWNKKLIIEKPVSLEFALKFDFQVKNPKKYLSLTIKKAGDYYIKDIVLNGKKVNKPNRSMIYNIIRGIDVSLLKKGANKLQISYIKWKKKKGRNRDRTLKAINAANVKLKLVGLNASDLAFQADPVLGYAGRHFLTMACRVTMPAEVMLEINNKQYVSKRGLLHTFKIEGLKAKTKYTYSLKTRLAGQKKYYVSIGPFITHTFTGGGKFKFAILGDSRTVIKDWRKVALATAKAAPEFAVIVGDMIANGTNNYEWNSQYFNPAKEFLSTIPTYSVIGNHEQNAPLFNQMFNTPSGDHNWSQQIGSVLIIGVNGAHNWKKSGKLYKWLEKLLSESKAKFIFLASHYPGWSSGGHGGEDKNGQPRELGVKTARNILMPLLRKYNATAMFAGHDHFYERSEEKDNVTVIITGGAGAPLRGKTKTAAKQNPHSKVFASKHHYCMIYVDGDACTMKVITPEGKVIDTTNWEARK